MDIHAWLRLIAGTFVLASVALGLMVNPWFLSLAVFVALNQIQSAFTGWCLMMTLLRRLGVPEHHIAPQT